MKEFRVKGTYHDMGLQFGRNLKDWPEDFLFYEYERRVKEWFEENKGSITVDNVKALCSNPQNGICEYYGNPGDNDEITIWSWIA